MPWQKQANKRFIKGCQSDNTSWAYDPNAQMIVKVSAAGTHADRSLWQKSITCLVETAEILDLKVVWGSCLTQSFGNIIESLLLGICRNCAFLQISTNHHDFLVSLKFQKPLHRAPSINRNCLLKNESALHLLNRCDCSIDSQKQKIYCKNSGYQISQHSCPDFLIAFEVIGKHSTRLWESSALHCLNLWFFSTPSQRLLFHDQISPTWCPHLAPQSC